MGTPTDRIHKRRVTDARAGLFICTQNIQDRWSAIAAWSGKNGTRKTHQHAIQTQFRMQHTGGTKPLAHASHRASLGRHPLAASDCQRAGYKCTSSTLILVSVRTSTQKP